MDTSRGKRNYYNEKMEENVSVEDYEEEEEEEDDDQDDKKIKRSTLTKKRSGGGGGMAPLSCQVESCTADMSHLKPYHRRHKVCEFHAKAPVVIVVGLHQRFCQQCSRFHVLSEFDDAKRSCRRRLAGHNERRRKSTSEYLGEGSI